MSYSRIESEVYLADLIITLVLFDVNPFDIVTTLPLVPVRKFHVEPIAHYECRNLFHCPLPKYAMPLTY